MMLMKKEVFDKYTQLISAGIIQTSAKNLYGLTLNEILNLPFNGTQLINLKSNNPVFIDLETLINNPDQEILDILNTINIQKETILNMSLETILTSFLSTITKVLKNNLTTIDKNPNSFEFYLSLKNCTLTKNDCIIDRQIDSYNYIIRFGENQQDSVVNLESGNPLFIELLYDKLVNKYVLDLINANYSKYTVLSALKIDNDIISNDPDIISTTEDNDIWFNDLLDNIILYIDFEFGIIDSQNSVNLSNYEILMYDSTPINLPPNITV